MVTIGEQYNEISELKEKLHKLGKVKARIQYWEMRTQDGTTATEDDINSTLKGVLKLFEQEE